MLPKLLTNESLSLHTTLKVGGPAQYFASFTTIEELQTLIEFAQEKSLPWIVIGEGSNILFSDGTIHGLVLKNRLKGVEVVYEDLKIVKVKVGSGEQLDDFILWTVGQGYWGLENLSHIPGTVGATPIQNVGAYGVEVSEQIESVEVFNPKTNKLEILTAKDCDFGYRNSFFKSAKGRDFIVLSVTYELSKLPMPILHYKGLEEQFLTHKEPSQTEIRQSVISIREAKFPDWHKVGTAGSFFKNPILDRTSYETLKEQYKELPGHATSDNNVKVPLGWILDNICKLKGYRNGAVGTYERQALVVVNHGGATAIEIVEFAEQITTSVFEATGINVEWEVTKFGF